jgi:type I restriction enzyme S subunit
MGDINNLIIDNIDIWTNAIKKRNSQGRGSSKKIELVGVKKLRELILELAVRGKLVSQDVNDEPASVLLKKIVEEKKQLIFDNKIKKKKSSPVISNEEKPFKIANNWEYIRLGDIGNIFNGNSVNTRLKETKYSGLNVGLPFIATKDVEYGFSSFDYDNGVLIPAGEPKFKVAHKNSVLVCAEGGSAGKKCGIANQDICFGNKLFANELFAEINPKFILSVYLSPTFFCQFSESMTGIIGGISSAKFSQLVISLPPLAEQHRIVAKVDELMTLCDELEQQTEQSLSAHQTLIEVLLNTLTASDNTEDFQTSWQRIAEHFDVLFTTEHSIEQLKQSILQLAVMGKLVPQNPSDEPACGLLEKIAVEKELLIKDKKIRKQKIQVIADDVCLYKLPEGWVWSQLGKLTASEDNAMCDGPFGSKLKTEHYINNKGFSVVRLGNIGVGKFLWGKEGHISKEHYETLPKNHIQSGDLIVAGMADPLIRTCEVPPNLGPAVNKADCFRLRIHNYLEKKYISHYLNSHVAKLFASEENQGMTRQRINLGNCKAIPVPIPPMNEQKTIVAKVDELMALCDQLKTCLADVQTTQVHLADAVVENALN